MNAEATVDELSQKHASLDAVIIEESQKPNPDFLKITELKRKKLRIKDQIAHLETH